MDASARTGKAANAVMILLVIFSLCNLVVSGKVHASIKNSLDSGKIITLHCQSKDNDLGQQNVAVGSEFGWDFSVNAVGSTLFYCDIGWEDVQQFHFDAFDFHRDFVRCQNQCLWLVSTEGMYGLNGRTGLWEFFYQWPN